MSVSFKVLGLPKPKGSKKFWGMSKKGKPIISEQSNNKDWLASVNFAASEAMKGNLPREGPLSVDLMFIMPVPISLQKKLSKNRVSRYPITRTGDIDKLTRAVFDAMTGIVYKDDSQIAEVHATKIYGEAPGVFVDVSLIE